MRFFKGKRALTWNATALVVLALALGGFYGCSTDKPMAPQNTAVTSPGESGDIIPGQYIVVLRSTEEISQYIGSESQEILAKRAAVADVTALADKVGAKPRQVYGTVVHGFSGKLTKEQYDALVNDPSVAYIEPDRVITMTAQTTPWGVNQINAPAAHARGVRGSGVKVAIIDTGIDHGHQDLAGVYAGGIDYVNGDNDPMDDNGHGTHVSGTVAAIDNTIGVIGVAPSVSLYGVKVLDQNGSGTFGDVVAGIDWAAANNMDVANMSLGASVGTSALQTACDNAWASGTIICAAAGNNYGGPVGYPAKYSSCIAVSSTTSSNTLSSFSNVGPEVEVAAPGSSIYSTYPGGYATMSGTSMATPHATGVVALIWSTGSYTTATAVRSQLTATCLDLGANGRDNSFGFGLVDADAATAGGGTPPPNQAPTANANGPYSGTAGTAISFSSAGSSDPDGTIAGYSWDFGDGGTSTAANPSHSYAAAGTYTVTLTVTDNQGATGTNSTTATVTSGGGGNQAPTANANGPYSGTAGTAISFSSAGSSDPDGTIVGYSWDFGDGGTSTTANPSHTYAAAGTYTVTLTVTDDLGATGSNSTTASVTAGGGGGADVVTIRKAEYDPGKQRLTVQARSDNPNATLTVVGYGVMTYNPNKNRWELRVNTSPAPANVTVTSNFGGSDTAPVVLD